MVKLKIKNQRLLSSIFLALLLIVLSLLFYLFLPKDRETKELTAYERLSEHCVEENRSSLKCYVFLKDYRKEVSEICMDIILPEIEVEKRDITVCFDKDIEWENPYGDYSMAVPIILNIYYENLSRKDTFPERIEIDLMEDERVYEILEEIFYTEGEAVRVMTKDVYTHIEQGYRYFVDWSSREGDRLLFLGINNSKIKSIENDGESIVMEISF